MINLSIDEKIALEEVFIVLDTRKRKKEELLRRYFSFYNKLMGFSLLKSFKKGE